MHKLDPTYRADFDESDSDFDQSHCDFDESDSDD
jgi:hypothetical protein